MTKSNEGKYDIDFRMDLRSLTKNIMACCDGTLKNTLTGNILKPYKMKKGHSQYSMSNNGKVKKILGHRLIAEIFVNNPRPEEYNCVNHKDGNPANNNYENLEWCTDRMNKNHAKENRMYQQSVNRYNAKFDDIKILTIHTLKWSQSSIGRHYKVASSVICNIKNFKTYSNFSVIYDK